MTMKRLDRSTAGFTLIEVMIVGAILSFIMLALFAVLHTSSSVYEEGTRREALEERLRLALTRISDEVRQASWGVGTPFTINEAATPGADDSADFQVCLGYTAGNPQWDPNPIRYTTITGDGEVENDGLDNNNNGLIDERKVVRIQNGVTAVVADFLRQGTLRFSDVTVVGAPKGTVQISMTLENVDPNRRRISTSGSVTVQVRNQ